MSKLRQKKAIYGFVFFLFLFVSSIAYGKTDLTLIKQKPLDVQPLDVAASADGDMIFILSPGELVIYSSRKDAIINRSAIDAAYDRMTYSEKNKRLILTSRSSESLKIIHVEQVHEISLSGLPVKGPSHAPVTIAVFDDYQ